MAAAPIIIEHSIWLFTATVANSAFTRKVRFREKNLAEFKRSEASEHGRMLSHFARHDIDWMQAVYLQEVRVRRRGFLVTMRRMVCVEFMHAFVECRGFAKSGRVKIGAFADIMWPRKKEHASDRQGLVFFSPVPEYHYTYTKSTTDQNQWRTCRKLRTGNLLS